MNILTTMITPYKKDGSIDYETAEKYVDFYFDSGIDGIFAVCQSSEIFFLTLEERVELNRRVYARAKALEKQGVVATVRRRLGADVNAACGQLRRSSMQKNQEKQEVED